MNDAALKTHILAEWATGKSALEIARGIGLTEGRVAGIISYATGPEAAKANSEHYRNRGARERPRQMTLENANREPRMLMLWADGASASDIAVEFGVTRNIVIGIIHRSRGEDAEAAKRMHTAAVAQRSVSYQLHRRNPHPEPLVASPAAKREGHKPVILVLSIAERREKAAAEGKAIIARVEAEQAQKRGNVPASRAALRRVNNGIPYANPLNFLDGEHIESVSYLPPRRYRPTLATANPRFIAKVEKPFDPYSHMRSEEGLSRAIAALSR